MAAGPTGLRRRRASVHTPGQPPKLGQEIAERSAFANPVYEEYPTGKHAPTHLPVSGSDPLALGIPVGVGLANVRGAGDAFAAHNHIHAATIPSYAGEPATDLNGLTLLDTTSGVLKRFNGASWDRFGPLTIEEVDSSPSVLQVTKLRLPSGSITDNGNGVVSLTFPSLTIKEQDGSPSVSNVSTIKLSNGTLTDEGGGVVSISLASGPPAAGGSNRDVQFNWGGSITGAESLFGNPRAGLVFEPYGYDCHLAVGGGAASNINTTADDKYTVMIYGMGNYASLSWKAMDNHYNRIQLAGGLSAIGTYPYNCYAYLGTTTSHDLLLQTNNVTRMTLSAAGSVTIGTFSGIISGTNGVLGTVTIGSGLSFDGSTLRTNGASGSFTANGNTVTVVNGIITSIA